MAQAGSQPKVPKRLWRLLKRGDSWSEYGGDPVRLVGAIVGLAVDHGQTLEWLEQQLQNPGNAAAAHVRTARPSGKGNPRGRVRMEDVRRWYERSSDGQLRTWRQDGSDREAHRTCLVDLQQLATSSTWPMWLEHCPEDQAKAVRVKGSDARKVLAAHLTLAQAAQGVDYPASRRKVAELAGVSDSVAQRATGVLLALGIVRRRRPPGDRPSGPFLSCWYRADTSGRSLRAILSAELPTVPELVDLAQFERHPLWRFGSGCRFDVWAQIAAADGNATTASVAAATGVKRATVRRVVRNLARLGLVDRCDDYTLRAASADHRAALDAAALATGMADRARRQLERHEAERAAFLQGVLDKPRLLFAAMRRKVRAVMAAVRAGRVRFMDTETGEFVTVSAERERRPLQLLGIGRPHAPPRRPLVLA